MRAKEAIPINVENQWRLETDEAFPWKSKILPGSPDKYLIVSVDTHMSPPPKMFGERIEAKFKDRLPRILVKDGKKYITQEGRPPVRIVDSPLDGEDRLRADAGATVFQIEMFEGGGIESGGIDARLADQDMDGVDAEVIFPNGPALLMWASADPEFVQAQCRVWNDWAIEVCRPRLDRLNPAAAIAPGDIDGSIAEVRRVAKLGYRAVVLPCKPIFGPIQPGELNYNLPVFDPLWNAIQEHDLTINYHVSTGMDPRTAKGNGGAVINYASNCLTSTISPLVHMCASDVFEKFPDLRVVSIEANAGWVPFILDGLDEAYRKHHMWTSPKLKMLPSEYFRRNCFVSFGEDRAAISLAEEYRIVDNLMWANDYPHHEGSWPHSGPAIERTLRNKLSEDACRKVLGLNAARVYKFEPQCLNKGH